MNFAASPWFLLFVSSAVLLAGNILLGHFEDRDTRWRRLAKSAVILLAMAALSVTLGNAVAFAVLGLSLLPVLYIHVVLLPRKGINGWTGEPRWKYRQLRGLDPESPVRDADPSGDRT